MRLLPAVLLILLCNYSFAQALFITGDTTKEFSVLVISDIISGRMTALRHEKGKIILPAGNRSASIETASGKKTIYWDKDTISIQLGKDDIIFRRDPGGINERMYEIDSVSGNFLDRIFSLPPNQRMPMAKVRGFADTLRRTYANDPLPIVRHFAHFSASYCEATGNAWPHHVLIRNTFNGKSDLPEVPGWAEVFHLIFDGYGGREFVKISGGLRGIFQVDNPGLELFNALKKDSSLLNDTLRQWVALNIIYEARSSRGIAPGSIVEALNYFDENAISKNVRSTAEQLLIRLIPTLRGTLVSDLGFLELQSGKELRIRGLKGKPLYLCYFPKLNENALRMMLLVNNMHRRFEKDLHFLVVVNDDPNRISAAVRQKGFKFPVSSLSSFDGDLVPLLDTPSLPSYILIDRYSKIAVAPAESPETGIEISMMELIRMK